MGSGRDGSGGLRGGATGETAVVFVSARNGDDEPGYAAASAAMEALAAVQPGYRGMRSARGLDGVGITVSWWADEAAAIAWRDHPDHARTRAEGRARWYDWFEVSVARVERRYEWQTAASAAWRGGRSAR